MKKITGSLLLLLNEPHHYFPYNIQTQYPTNLQTSISNFKFDQPTYLLVYNYAGQIDFSYKHSQTIITP